MDSALTARFAKFHAVSGDDVIAATGHLPDKSSATDPVSTSMLNMVSDPESPFVAELVNCSMARGQVYQVVSNVLI